MGGKFGAIGLGFFVILAGTACAEPLQMPSSVVESPGYGSAGLATYTSNLGQLHWCDEQNTPQEQMPVCLQQQSNAISAYLGLGGFIVSLFAAVFAVVQANASARVSRQALKISQEEAKRQQLTFTMEMRPWIAAEISVPKPFTSTNGKVGGEIECRFTNYGRVPALQFRHELEVDFGSWNKPNYEDRSENAGVASVTGFRHIQAFLTDQQRLVGSPSHDGGAWVVRQGSDRSNSAGEVIFPGQTLIVRMMFEVSDILVESAINAGATDVLPRLSGGVTYQGSDDPTSRYFRYKYRTGLSDGAKGRYVDQPLLIIGPGSVDLN